MAVLTLTMLLTVVEFAAVPTVPKTPVSVEPGLPVAGIQLALTFQLLAPGDATFQRKVVAASAKRGRATELRISRRRQSAGSRTRKEVLMGNFIVRSRLVEF